MTHRVCVIIPAYNEEQTIAEVVSVVVASPLIDEVIVVSDGSTDQTAERAEAAGAMVCVRTRRHGKGQALLYALSYTEADVLVFLDADLRGLTLDHLERLVLPVLSGARAMNIGLRDRGGWYTKLALLLPLISGERALRRGIIERIAPEFLQGLMVEIALNQYCQRHKLTFGAVVLSGLSIRTKYEKVGYVRGVLQYLYMSFQIIQAHLVIRLASLFNTF